MTSLKYYQQGVKHMRNSLHHQRLEFIGRPCEVADANHAGYVGMKGIILDETRKTFVIATPAGERRIPKVGNTFRFKFDEKEAILNGRNIVYRPEERIKKAKVN